MLSIPLAPRYIRYSRFNNQGGRVRNLSAVVLKRIARYKLVRSFKMEKSYFEAKISFNAFPLYHVR